MNGLFIKHAIPTKHYIQSSIDCIHMTRTDRCNKFINTWFPPLENLEVHRGRHCMVVDVLFA